LKPYIELKVKEQEAKAEDEQESKKILELRLEHCRDLVKYFEEAERALIDHGAKTWAEINPIAAAAQEMLKTNVVSPQTYGTPPSLATQNIADPEEFLAKHYKAPSVPLLFVLERVWSSEPASVHTIPLYEELFEACWKGNNERIKELCLPPKTGKSRSDPEYLQITCEVRFNSRIPVQPCLDDNVAAEISTFKEYPSTGSTWGKSISRLLGHFETPWKALLLCTLLSCLRTGKPQRSSLRSQLLNTRHPPARRLTTMTVVSYSCVPHLTSHFYLREGRDEECDEDSDIEVDDGISDELNRKAEIMDISHRFSTLRVPVGPSALFSTAPHLSEGRVSHWTPLAAAVRAADMEAAKQIIALHELCAPLSPVNPHAELDNILQCDSPAMLDLFIRKFGIGLGFSEEEENGPQATDAIKKMPKTYLGLDVHGVKRKDLAKRNDPDAPSSPHSTPLVCCH